MTKTQAKTSTRQLAFRLTPAEIGLLDELVQIGLAVDRTSALKRALAAERRRLDAQRDAEIYASGNPDDDLLALAAWASTQALDLD